jgi:hypothetical protein
MNGERLRARYRPQQRRGLIEARAVEVKDREG